MYRRSLSAAILAILGSIPSILGAEPASTAASVPPAAPPTYTEGWMDLFPAPDFAHWTRKPLNPAQALHTTTQWTVDPAAHVLTCSGDQGHEWLRYDQEFTDTLLHVEWRFKPLPPTSTANPASVNAGIYVRNNADGWIYHQAQVKTASYLFAVTPVNGIVQRMNLPTKPWPEALPAAAKLLVVDPVNRITDAFAWNTTDILCEGRTITLWVNGAFQSRLESCEIPRGFVGLEAEGFAIEFRDVRLRELP